MQEQLKVKKEKKLNRCTVRSQQVKQKCKKNTEIFQNFEKGQKKDNWYQKHGRQTNKNFAKQKLKGQYINVFIFFHNLYIKDTR